VDDTEFNTSVVLADKKNVNSSHCFTDLQGAYVKQAFVLARSLYDFDINTPSIH
jgi:hypothetical protein